MPQIEKLDAGRLLSTMEITQNSLAVILTVSLAADLSDPHLAKALPFTDTSMKMGSLSVDLSEILAKIGRAASPFWKRQLFHTQKVRLSKDKGTKTKI